MRLGASLPRPSEKADGLSRAVGGGGTTRAAVYALSSMGLSPIFLVNRDPTETASIISTPAFAKYDLRALEKEEQWSNEEAERIACGVGAIPSFQPQTEGEKMVYRLAELVFESSGKKEGKRPLVRALPCSVASYAADVSLYSSKWPTRCDCLEEDELLEETDGASCSHTSL